MKSFICLGGNFLQSSLGNITIRTLWIISNADKLSTGCHHLCWLLVSFSASDLKNLPRFFFQCLQWILQKANQNCYPVEMEISFLTQSFHVIHKLYGEGSMWFRWVGWKSWRYKCIYFKYLYFTSLSIIKS